MTWTTYASLTNPTLQSLDANFNILSGLTPIPCVVTGTNTLALASTQGAGSVTAYANYMRFTGIAANTNSGATTANFAGLGALNVYKDTPSGPVVLAGNEIVQNNEFTLIYDLALNSGAGGFHLKTGSSELVGQTLTVAAINASATGSVAGLFRAASVLFGGGSVSNLFSVGTINAANFSISGPASLTSLVVGGGANVTRINSGTGTLGFTVIPSAGRSLSTIAVAGALVGDAVMVGPNADFALAGTVSYAAYIAATNSVILSLTNPGAASCTIGVNPVSFRITTIGNT